MKSAIVVGALVVLVVGIACGRVMFYSALAKEDPSEGKLLAQVDHIIYGTTDLDRGIAEIEKLTGVRAKFGGQHPGRGTCNALLALGPASYLEIIAPDPDQPAPNEPRSFGIDGLKQPRVVGWAAKGQSLEQFVAEAKRKEIEFGAVRSGSRKRPDGVVLSWTTADPNAAVGDEILPFFIDWGQSPHPAQTAPSGLTLVELRAEHPEPEKVQAIVDRLGIAMKVRKGVAPALVAVVKGPNGRVELR
jgi:Glyoxalase-like domain